MEQPPWIWPAKSLLRLRWQGDRGGGRCGPAQHPHRGCWVSLWGGGGGAGCSPCIVKWNEFMNYKFYLKVGNNSRNNVVFLKRYKVFFSNRGLNQKLRRVQWKSTELITMLSKLVLARTLPTSRDISAKSRWLRASISPRASWGQRRGCCPRGGAARGASCVRWAASGAGGGGCAQVLFSLRINSVFLKGPQLKT